MIKDILEILYATIFYALPRYILYISVLLIILKIIGVQ